jgi:hypothetical protein
LEYSRKELFCWEDLGITNRVFDIELS